LQAQTNYNILILWEIFGDPMKDDLIPLLSEIIDNARTLLGAKGGSIFLLEGNSLVLRAATGLDARSKQMNLPIYRVGIGVTGRAAATNTVIVLNDIEQNKHMFDSTVIQSAGVYDQAEGEKLLNMIIAPIRFNDKTIGVIRCANKNSAFTDHDQSILIAFANTAGAAIAMRKELYLATNAPYLFVLMPFLSDYSDIYEYGIKSVANVLGIRCERVDEIEFNDLILEQIYKGIQRADIVVADMTGRNPNVFYEVGYAHALGKEVILLTQDISDMPFDLKGHNIIVYSGKIKKLSDLLSKRLTTWAKNREK
jgi:putative methionine-R-sulfoxide reductase with GAF domain